MSYIVKIHDGFDPDRKVKKIGFRTWSKQVLEVIPEMGLFLLLALVTDVSEDGEAILFVGDKDRAELISSILTEREYRVSITEVDDDEPFYIEAGGGMLTRTTDITYHMYDVECPSAGRIIKEDAVTHRFGLAAKVKAKDVDAVCKAAWEAGVPEARPFLKPLLENSYESEK